MVFASVRAPISNAKISIVAPRCRNYIAKNSPIEATYVCHAAKLAVEDYRKVQSMPVKINGDIDSFPAQSGVFSVSDSDGVVRFIGISRNINLSIVGHIQNLGDVVHSVKVGLVPNGTKEELTDAWKEWLQSCADETGKLPPGNADPEEKLMWQVRRQVKAKPELKLTPGKGADDLTCNISNLVDMVVKSEKTVVFIKGTRTQPQCGFSHQMLVTLNSIRADYEVVNVLDEIHNPGLREVIKEYSDWPTIPQLYIDGEFVGGADIVQQLASTGELTSMVAK